MTPRLGETRRNYVYGLSIEHHGHSKVRVCCPIAGASNSCQCTHTHRWIELGIVSSS